MEAGVTINTMGCTLPDSFSMSVPGNCHLWGSDGSQDQMLFIYLLRITPADKTLTLYYINDSNSSQMNSSRHQLCAANSNFEIIEMITSCTQNFPDHEPSCCSNFNVNIYFNEGKMEVHFLSGFIEIPVDYLDCTSKS